MRNVHFAKMPDKIPPVGIGGIVIDPPNPTWISKNDFVKILDFAIDKCGIRYIDTAMAYGVAETTIGEWLNQRDRPSDLLIGSKTAGPTEAGAKFNSEFILQRLRQSLEKLKVNLLDIYWLHAPHEGTSIEETAQGFAEAVSSGLTKTYGLCNVSAEQLEKTLAHLSRVNLPLPGAIQNEYSLLTISTQKDVLKLCRAHGISCTAFSPLASGVLAGRYQWNKPPPPNSRWDVWRSRRAYPEYWNEKNFTAVDRFLQLAKELETSPAVLALAWMFHNPDVDMTLLGPRTLPQMEISAQAFDFKITTDAYNKIRNLFSEP